jgi:hypothetical protein
LLYNNKSITKKTKENILSKRKSVNDFHEILCPMSLLSLNSTNCSTCQYCKITANRHSSGRTLTTFVCLFGTDKVSDEK